MPWPADAELSSGFESLSPKSKPATWVRSGCPVCTPVSMIAMITELDPKPCVWSHAACALRVEADGADRRAGLMIVVGPVVAQHLVRVVVAPVHRVERIRRHHRGERDVVERHRLDLGQLRQLVRSVRRRLSRRQVDGHPAIDAQVMHLVLVRRVDERARQRARVRRAQHAIEQGPSRSTRPASIGRA